MNYNELSQKAHENAVIHGFWDEKHSNEHYLMLIVTEISEMVEADRKNNRAVMSDLFSIYDIDNDLPKFNDDFELLIKNTVEDELADVAIRLFDLSGALGIDFDKMMPCRYYRAFDRFCFTENAFALCKGLQRDPISVEKRIQFGIEYVISWAEQLNIDLEFFVGLKMKYNESRDKMHLHSKTKAK